MNLEKLIQKANEFLLQKYNLKPETTQLNLFNEEQWQHLLQRTGEEQTDGFFVPKYKHANINANSKNAVFIIFHEYFGHGLFEEYSEYDINADTEQYYLHSEAFAMWMEQKMTTQLVNEGITIYYPDQHAKILQSIKEIEDEWGWLGVFGTCKMPKHYNQEDVKELIRNHARTHNREFESAILYGSQKPKSDIDLVLISKHKYENIYTEWLDIFNLKRGEFFQRIKNLDIAVTDPAFSGTILFDKNNDVKLARELAKTTNITQNKITYNENMSTHQQTVANQNKHHSQSVAKQYSKTYSLNSKHLRRGEKLLTMKRLIQV